IFFFFFFFNDTATTEIYTLSLHDALPITDPSAYSTIECTTLCGWTTTWICSGLAPKSHRASMISSPLFIMVAESTEILRPMTQFGWAQASSGVTRCSSARARLLNGPPDPVRRILRTPLATSSPDAKGGRH